MSGQPSPRPSTPPQEPRRRILGCAACGLSLLLGLPRCAAAAAGSDIASLPALGDAGQGLLSPALEQRLGQRIMDQMRQEPEYLHDVVLREYLQGIVDRLRAAALASAEPDAPRNFEVFLVRDATFNAFALPGGHIGVHTGLVVDCVAEAQLAAVFAHEMSHITQRHIEQRLAQAKGDGLLSIGSLVLAVLAGMAGSGQAAEGLALGGQAAAADRALRFSRNNERDADRVGVSVLRASGYPPQAMASMLERLQNLSRLNDGDVFAFLQDHPLNSERIADAQARGGDQALPADTSLVFWLMNARARVLNLQRSEDWLRLAEQLAHTSPDRPDNCAAQHTAWAYGTALALMLASRLSEAQTALDRADKLGAEFDARQRLPLELARVDLLLAQGHNTQALERARALRTLAPDASSTLHALAQALLAQRDKLPARDFLREQTVLHPKDRQLWTWLAQSCAATGQFAAQHRATAEAYALRGDLDAAILQLKIAQRTPGADYFEASIIDARLKAMQTQQQRDKNLDRQLPQ